MKNGGFPPIKLNDKNNENNDNNKNVKEKGFANININKLINNNNTKFLSKNKENIIELSKDY